MSMVYLCLWEYSLAIISRVFRKKCLLPLYLRIWSLKTFLYKKTLLYKNQPFGNVIFSFSCPRRSLCAFMAEVSEYKWLLAKKLMQPFGKGKPKSIP